MSLPVPPPAAAVAPAPAGALQAAVRERPAGRAFPFLDLYYRLGAAKRTLFTVAYRWRAVAPDDCAWRPAAVTLRTPGQAAAPIAVSPLGWLERVPTARELALHPQVELSGPEGWRLAMILAPQAVLGDPAAATPADIVAAVDQFERGVRAAGPVAYAIPRFGRVLFAGAAGVSLVDGGGRAVRLPAVRGEVFARVADLRAAAALRYDTPPERVLLLPG